MAEPTETARRSGETGTDDDVILCGMDVPLPGSWGPEDVTFWSGTKHYQPWKDVAAFFSEDGKNG